MKLMKKKILIVMVLNLIQMIAIVIAALIIKL